MGHIGRWSMCPCLARGRCVTGGTVDARCGQGRDWIGRSFRRFWGIRPQTLEPLLACNLANVYAQSSVDLQMQGIRLDVVRCQDVDLLWFIQKRLLNPK
jgi:hypothetical protein